MEKANSTRRANNFHKALGQVDSVNLSDWRGERPRTVKLTNTLCHTRGRRHKFTFVFSLRQETFDLKVDQLQFQIYEQLNFKYFLRPLHRHGIRNTAIKIRRAKETSVLLNANGTNASNRIDNA